MIEVIPSRSDHSATRCPGRWVEFHPKRVILPEMADRSLRPVAAREDRRSGDFHWLANPTRTSAHIEAPVDFLKILIGEAFRIDRRSPEAELQSTCIFDAGCILISQCMSTAERHLVYHAKPTLGMIDVEVVSFQQSVGLKVVTPEPFRMNALPL